MEEDKEVCDKELIELKGLVEEYKNGQIGLKEASAEVKYLKQELTKRDR